ncbi:hypothetical protein C0J52_05541 [Blattella germanica]|nr:hypothetical protein C0J52_05541 [Blattella germanica]
MNTEHHELPILETRKVLMNHLYAKVWPLCQSGSFANGITSRIADKLTDKEIISLLENDAELGEVVNSLMSNKHVIKQEIGERLFVAVAKLDSELCAQITGMLLELDDETLESLLSNNKKLQTTKVGIHCCDPKEKQEDFGEVVYNLVLQHHSDPELAARLTGMLLELESRHLQSLVQDPDELKAKLDIACKVLCVHHSLRSRAHQIGPDEAWKEHCSKEDRLKEYAVAMKTLASVFWKENAEDTTKSAQCRIEWVAEKCKHYFFGPEREILAEREAQRMKTLKGSNWCLENCDHVSNSQTLRSVEVNVSLVNEPGLKLLDVGSCYNPFKVYPFFQVVPIDLAPASPDVFQCDFLNVDVATTVKPETSQVSTLNCISELTSCSFDIVVFSLLLEYFPSPKQRYSCAFKAYQLLKPEGLLFIITPDSKHSSANAPIMKSWRIVLARLGFSRVYYEKLPHVHCMAYRKDIHPEISLHWATLALSKQKYEILREAEGLSSLYIPQDFQEIVEENNSLPFPKVERTNEDDEKVVVMFSELPIDFE